MADAIQARDLSVNAPTGAQLLNAVSFTVQQGRWLAVVGPNGAGKSTLLRAMVGVLAKNYRVNGQIVCAQSLSWLAQTAQPMQGTDFTHVGLTVRQIVALGRLPHRAKTLWFGGETWDTQADIVAIDRAMELTQCSHLLSRGMAGLSGGELQRVLLARVIATGADVVLLDEPLAHLDPPHQADCIRLIRALVAEGKTVVSVLHDLNAAILADELLLLQNGKVLAQGEPQDAPIQAALLNVFAHKIKFMQDADGQLGVRLRV